jgi:hypothetical protein
MWKDRNGFTIHFPLTKKGKFACYKLGHWSKPLTYK